MEKANNRWEEDELKKDQLDGIDVYTAGAADVNFIYERYISTKTELRPTTRANYEYTYAQYVRDVLNGDLGITFKNEAEDDANLYAQRSLISEDAYVEFKNWNKSFTEEDIRSFADAIDQDPGIVYGRLQIDGKIPYTETYLSSRLRHKYKVVIA